MRGTGGSLEGKWEGEAKFSQLLLNKVCGGDRSLWVSVSLGVGRGISAAEEGAPAASVAQNPGSPALAAAPAQCQALWAGGQPPGFPKDVPGTAGQPWAYQQPREQGSSGSRAIFPLAPSAIGWRQLSAVTNLCVNSIFLSSGRPANPSQPISHVNSPLFEIPQVALFY